MICYRDDPSAKTDAGSHSLGSLSHHLILILLLTPTWLFAQPSDEAFIESVRVHVVNVDVVVTDDKGEPVPGLSREDFVLRENGRVVPITNFRAPEADPRSGPIDPEPSPPSPAQPPSSEGPGDADPGQVLVIFIDNFHLQPASRNRALRRLRGSLSDIVRPGDRIMVVTYERSLHVRQALTSDLRDVRIALIEAETLATFGGQRNTERERLLARIESARSLGEAEIQVDGLAQSEFYDASKSFEGVRELLELLTGLPGRKVVLHVSDGIPMTASAGLFYLLDLKFRGGGTGGFLSQRYSLRNDLRELTAAANASGATFYTLEAFGASTAASTSASRSGTTTIGTFLDAELVRLSSNQETLVEMAADTGGMATVGTNRVELVYEHIANDRQATYSLGFQSSHQGDGRYYTLQVELAKKGLKARHRKGYRNKSLETQLEESALAALRYGTGENPLGLRLEVGAAQPDSGGNYLVPFELRVPFDQVVLVPREQFHVGQLRVIQVALDQEGERSQPEQTVLPLSVPAKEIETALQHSVVYQAELLMEAGEHRLVVGVLDEISTRTAFLRRIVQVGGR